MMTSSYLANEGQERVNRKFTLSCRSPWISMELSCCANAAISTDVWQVDGGSV